MAPSIYTYYFAYVKQSLLSIRYKTGKFFLPSLARPQMIYCALTSAAPSFLPVCVVSCSLENFLPSPAYTAEVESRTKGSRPRTQKNPRPRTAFPRTDTLEAKDRNARGQDQGHKRKCSPKKKKRFPQKFFRRSPKKKKRSSQK